MPSQDMGPSVWPCQHMQQWRKSALVSKSDVSKRKKKNMYAFFNQTKGRKLSGEVVQRKILRRNTCHPFCQSTSRLPERTSTIYKVGSAKSTPACPFNTRSPAMLHSFARARLRSTLLSPGNLHHSRTWNGERIVMKRSSVNGCPKMTLYGEHRQWLPFGFCWSWQTPKSWTSPFFSI